MPNDILIGLIPLISAIITSVFAANLLNRWRHGRRVYTLFWGIGMTFYAIGGAMEAYYGFFGWNPLVFRLWYLFGAILVAAWLGQGTVFLLARRKVAWTLFYILAAASLYAVYKVFTAELDPRLMIEGELSGHAIVSPGVRILTPFFNIYGVVTLVGGALYSAWLFWRKRVLLNRTIGNILIAVGALAPAFGGAFQRLGVPYTLYFGELIGAILIFIGFMYAIRPMPKRQTEPSPQSVSA